MTALFPDTDPKTQAVLIDLLRKAPPWRKAKMVDDLNQAVKLLAMVGLRQRHPGESESKLHRRLADILLGPELALKVYGPMVEE